MTQDHLAYLISYYKVMKWLGMVYLYLCVTIQVVLRHFFPATTKRVEIDLFLRKKLSQICLPTFERSLPRQHPSFSLHLTFFNPYTNISFIYHIPIKYTILIPYSNDVSTDWHRLRGLHSTGRWRGGGA